MKLTRILPLATLPLAMLLVATPSFAQETGQSHPEQLDDTITATPQPAAPQYRKPSPAIPADSSMQSTDGSSVQSTDHYVPPSHVTHESVNSLPLNEQLADSPSSASSSTSGATTPRAYDPDSQVVGDGQPSTAVSRLPLNEQLADPADRQQSAVQSTTPQLQTRQAPPDIDPLPPPTAQHEGFVVTDDPRSGVVLAAAVGPNELPAGTFLRARLQTTISTEETRAGAHFSAGLTMNVMRNGKIFLPIGSTINGRMTQIHPGHHLGSAAAIRLQATNIVFPDGTSIPLTADVVDVDAGSGIHVGSEGTINDKGLNKKTVATVGTAVGGGAVVGAVVGGGVGAAVGAGIGAGVGTYYWITRDRQATLPVGTDVVFALNDNISFNNGIPAE